MIQQVSHKKFDQIAPDSLAGIEFLGQQCVFGD
jgi:hypothetical protein